MRGEGKDLVVEWLIYLVIRYDERWFFCLLLIITEAAVSFGNSYIIFVTWMWVAFIYYYYYYGGVVDDKFVVYNNSIIIIIILLVWFYLILY